MSSTYPTPLRARVAIFVFDKSSYGAWISIFLGIVLLFGITFAVLSPFGHGMHEETSLTEDVDFFQGIYFSIVTISSLGYGDIQPKGAGKILAGIEVVLGLSIIGVMIAKLTSKPVTHLVSRLFLSETKKQMDKFKALFDARSSDFESLLDEVRRVFQQTPAQTPGQPVFQLPGKRVSQPPATTALVAASLKAALDNLLQSSSELRDYIEEEGFHKSYFVLAPTVSFIHLAKAVEGAYFFLEQSIASLPFESNPSIRVHVLTRSVRRTLLNSLSAQKDTCQMVTSGFRIDNSVKKAFRDILVICDGISESLLPLQEQPNQLLLTS